MHKNTQCWVHTSGVEWEKASLFVIELWYTMCDLYEMDMDYSWSNYKVTRSFEFIVFFFHLHFYNYQKVNKLKLMQNWKIWNSFDLEIKISILNMQMVIISYFFFFWQFIFSYFLNKIRRLKVRYRTSFIRLILFFVFL